MLRIRVFTRISQGKYTIFNQCTNELIFKHCYIENSLEIENWYLKIRIEYNEMWPDHRVLFRLSPGYARLRGTYLRVPTSSAMSHLTLVRCAQIFAEQTRIDAEISFEPSGPNYVSATFRVRSAFFRAHLTTVRCDIRLACLIHAASVHPELGSNSKLRQDSPFGDLASESVCANVLTLARSSDYSLNRARLGRVIQG